MKHRLTATVFLMIGLFFLVNSAKGAEYTRKAYECSIEGTQQDIFTEVETLPCRDRIQFGHIRDNKTSKPITEGFFYYADSSCPVKLDANFHNFLWRHAELKPSNNHPYGHVLLVQLDRTSTIKLLQHLGSNKIEETDDLPPLEIIAHPDTPQVRQAHLPHHLKNGLSFHGVYKCKEIPFSLNLIGRPQASPALVLRGDKTVRLGLGKAPNWAQQVRVAIKGRDHSLAVSDLVTIEIDPKLALGQHRIDVAYARADGTLGPVRILDFTIAPIPAPQVVDKEILISKSATTAVIKMKGKHPEWAAKIQAFGATQSSEHSLDATITVKLSKSFQQSFDLRYLLPDGRVGEKETVTVKLH